MYKWVDENGQIHWSDSAPPPDGNANILKEYNTIEDKKAAKIPYSSQTKKADFTKPKSDRWSGKVVDVLDGDTIAVMKGSDRVNVRLYGIDTPEKSQWYGQNAKAFTSSQVLGKVVKVEGLDLDRYGRIVAIVSVGDLVINRHLVEYGYAWVYRQYCKQPFCSNWQELEAVARGKKRGLWKNPNAIPPWEYRHAKRTESTPPPPPKAPATTECDCSRDRYNCSNFKSRAEAQACFDKCVREVGRDIHKLDRDGDGRVCESLP